MLTAKEVLDFIYSNKLNEQDIEYFDPIKYAKTNENKTISIKVEEQYGGEGMGDEYYIVLKTECENTIQYWMVPGFYQSYKGSEIFIDETYEVLKNYVRTISWDPKK